MLTRDQLIKLAVDDYFIGCNINNHQQVMSTMSNDCVMRFPAATFRYDGHEALSCLLYTSPSPRDLSTSRMPSSA